MASDPNGWVTNPPMTIVKVQNTSRAERNGQLGVVVQYVSDTQRYIVHLFLTQDQVALRTANLVKASWMEQIKGQYQLVRYDRRVQQQLQQMTTAVEQRTGQSIRTVGAVAIVLLLGLIYLVGFTRIIMTLSFLLLLGTIAAPDLQTSTPWRVVLQRFPQRCRDKIREIPYVGPQLAANQYLSYAVMGLVLFVYARSLFPTAAPPKLDPSFYAATSSSSGSSSAASTTATAASLQELKEQFYKLGFDDATNLQPFGTSLPSPTTTVDPDTLLPPLEDEFIPPPKAGKSWWEHVGLAMSATFVFRTVMTLGTDPTSGQFSIARARESVRTMEPVQMALFGMAIYKLVTAVL